MKQKYKLFRRQTLHIISTCIIMAALISCNKAKSKENTPIHVSKEEFVVRGKVQVKNIANTALAKKVLLNFPAENWNYRSFRTLKAKLLRELIEKESAIPFILQSNEHILVLKEMYMNEDDWQEKRAIANFAVFQEVASKDVYVFVSEGLIQKNNENAIFSQYQNFWHYEGKKWTNITESVNLSKLKELVNVEALSQELNIKSNLHFFLQADSENKEVINCHLLPTIAAKMRMDNSSYLIWTGNGFEIEHLDIAISN